MRIWLKRALLAVAGALVCLMVLFTISPLAQSFIVGYFSRIYLGGSGVGTSTGPQIRWGAGSPAALTCTKGSIYLQTTDPDVGGQLWACYATDHWNPIAFTSEIGNDFYAVATKFGVTCDGSTDDTDAIQGAINAAYLFGKAGHVVLPPGVCNTTGTVIGPVTVPWQVDPADPLNLTGVGLAFTAPRAATVTFVASPSSSISWTGTTITSADIGNEIFYGTADPEYTSLGVTRVTRPTYSCTITAVLTGTTGTCVASAYESLVGVPFTTTAGAKSVFITDDHSFTIDNAVFNATPAALTADHVGKTMTFVLPVIRAPLDFDNVQRPGSHVIFEPVPAPCTNSPLVDDWQCLQGANIKSRYFNATITSVIDPTHGTFQIVGLENGSNSSKAFPDYPDHAGTGGVCGGPEPNCASLPSHEWAHLVPDTDGYLFNMPHMNHLVDITIMSAYNQNTNSHTYLGHIFPYIQPVDTAQRYISFRGASQAATLLRFIGNDTGNAALIFSKNKYFDAGDFGVVNAASGPDQVQTELAGAGAGNVDNGVHGYRVSCTYNGNGFYSMMSAIEDIDVVDKAVDGKIQVSVIPTCGTDPLNKRTLFRSKADQDQTGPWYFLATIADNTTTTYLDNIADASLGAAQSEKGNTIGIYMGGLPGPGTQTLQFLLSKIGVDGFNIGLWLGDGLGGEISDSVFNQFGVTHNDFGVRIGPGSFNTLDLTFNEFAGGENKVAMLNFEGNVVVNWGSMSYNAIDFWAAGFGPFRVENMRTEGPGIPFVGGEPGLALRSNNMAEPSGTRQIEGDVTATPADIHTVTGVDVSNISVGVPADSFYPITFGVGDITQTDVRKITVLPGLGPAGADVVGYIWEIDSTTTGKFYSPVAGAVVSAGVGVTITIYDSNLADLTFPTDQLTPADVGGSLKLPEASIGSSKVRCMVTEVTTSTTGQCGFFLGGQGQGPVSPAGGTTTDPYLFVHMAVYLDSTTGIFENNIWKSGMVVLPLDAGAGGSYTFNNNELLSLGRWPLVPLATGKRWALDIDSNTHQDSVARLPNPTAQNAIANGLLLPWTFVDDTNQGFTGSVVVNSHGNSASIYGGPNSWPLNDGLYQNLVNTEETLLNLLRPLVTFDSPLNPFAPFRLPVNGGPVAGMNQLSRIKQLSESGFADGRNLRILCSFATSDTATCPFIRSEAYEVRRGVGSPTTFDPVTRTYGVNVTSGHFTQADVGKVILFPACCGDGSVGDNYSYIVEIVSATVIQIRSMAGGLGFGNGITSGTATVGQDEPDAKWLPAVWGCSGLDLAAKEVVKITSFTASQVVLTSSNATSTAGCLVGVIR